MSRISILAFALLASNVAGCGNEVTCTCGCKLQDDSVILSSGVGCDPTTSEAQDAAKAEMTLSCLNHGGTVGEATINCNVTDICISVE